MYFADNAFPGCEKAEVVGNVSQSLKDQVKSRFVIGPVAHKRFWDGERARMTIDRGPCETRFPSRSVSSANDRAQGDALKTT